jgi:uncharacterized membrane-anchored protein
MKKLLALAFLSLSVAAFASDPTPPAPDPAAQLAAIRKLASGLKPQKGEIVLGDGLAKANLSEHLRYLNAEDTNTVLVKLWGNPKGIRNLGMVVPDRFDPLSPDSWAVVVSFEEDGYVKDDDAAKIDYSKLLGEMQTGIREANDERVKQGYQPIELVGWAKPPRYDAAAKKLYWAKELKFGNSPEHTLNYNIRMLGRRGVLVLNAIASMNQLAQIEAATPTILSAVNFQDGHRYADFKEGTDKVATYGLAALVAGGIAAKAGFFKLLWVGILAFKKVLLVLFIALGSQVKKIWRLIHGRVAPKSPFSGNDSETPPAAP